MQLLNTFSIDPSIQYCANIVRLATPPINPQSLRLRFFIPLSSKLAPLYNTSMVLIIE